jgi:VCBS repeat-containing protein
VNDAPDAKNDTDQFIEDTVATGNVITGVDTLTGDGGKDSDLDDADDDLSVTQFQIAGSDPVTVPADGSASEVIEGVGTFEMKSDGNYTFTPEDNYNGEVPVITYTLSDGELTDDAELRFQEGVDVNDLPEAVDDEVTAPENEAVSGNALDNDTDPEDDDLTITEVNGENVVDGGTSVDGSDGGTFTVNPDGTWTFDPGTDFDDLAEGETQVTTVTYTVDDGNGGESTAEIEVTVVGGNDAPSVIDPETGEPGVPGESGGPSTTDPIGPTEENTTGDPLPNRGAEDGVTITDIDVKPNFGDLDSDDNAGTLKYSASNLPEGLSISEDGIISGTLDPDASQGGDNNDGVYTITVVATDKHGESVTDTFTYAVTNPGPEAQDDAVKVVEDTAATGNVISGAGTNVDENDAPILDGDGNPIGKDTDPDGDDLSVTQFQVPGSDPVTVPEDGSASQLIDGVGTIEMGSDGSFTFTPVENYNGTVPDITYTLSDGQGETSTADLVIGDIKDVNDAPEAVDDGTTIDEDSTATFNLLENDKDLDGNELAVESVIINGQNIVIGEETIIDEGTILIQENGDVIFVPTEDYAGVLSGSYVTTDGELNDGAGFTVIVNDLPEPVEPSVLPDPALDSLDPVDPDGVDFVNEGGVITRTVQDIQSLNRPQEQPSTIDGSSAVSNTSYETASAIFNLGPPQGLIGDYIAIDLGQFDGDTLIAEGLITSEDIQTAENEEDVLKLFVNTYVRQNTLYIDIASNEDSIDKTVVKNYKVASLDGTPLPEWIRMARDGFVIAEPPADVRSIDLMITAELEDGSTIDRAVSIESLTGIIRMAELNAEEIQRAQSFSDKLKSELDQATDADDIL